MAPSASNWATLADADAVLTAALDQAGYTDRSYYRVPGGYALATRLAYFLWSAPPDEVLSALAAKRELRKPDVLRTQVERMLKDPRARAFTANFTGQWLSLRDIAATTPDKQLYPEFEEWLQGSMVRETHAFFDVLLNENLSVKNFVDSDFAMLNGRLAKHYGIPGVSGFAFQKVRLPPESHRGGLLTMGAVLGLTSDGTRHRPVHRGVWLSEVVLGKPPPPPPANVPAIEPDNTPATLAPAVMTGLLRDSYKLKVATNGEQALKVACSTEPPASARSRWASRPTHPRWLTSPKTPSTRTVAISVP